MATPEARGPLPAVDDRLVMPEKRAEIVRGALLMTPPADEPHGTSHLALAYVLGAHVAEGFRGAVDMLTRTSEDSDFAPDASVFPKERDPATGRRRLEELAFEIVSEQWIGVPSEKARELARRGVRRIFCIVLRKGRALEWSRETDGWQMLGEGSRIEDPCLATPIPVSALLDAAEADRSVVEALRARGLLRELEAQRHEEGRQEGRLEGRQEGRLEGRLAGQRQGVRALCDALGIPLDEARSKRLEELDSAGLDALIDALGRERAWPAS